MGRICHLLGFIWQPTEATTSRAQPGPPLLRLVFHSISEKSLVILLDPNLFQVAGVILDFEATLALHKLPGEEALRQGHLRAGLAEEFEPLEQAEIFHSQGLQLR